jgi:hypothetical protein
MHVALNRIQLSDKEHALFLKCCGVPCASKWMRGAAGPELRRHAPWQTHPTRRRNSKPFSPERRARRNQSLALNYGAAGGGTIGIELDARVVPATITALTSLLGQVMSTLPEEEWPSFQVLKTTAMGLAMNAEGELALALELEGGGQLTLGLAKGDLAVLRDEIDEAMRIAGDSRH